ncbi:MAG: hypothetical protein ACFFBD_27010 [Candidatus Hodarchaeota archaeon]
MWKKPTIKEATTEYMVTWQDFMNWWDSLARETQDILEMIFESKVAIFNAIKNMTDAMWEAQKKILEAAGGSGW